LQEGRVADEVLIKQLQAQVEGLHFWKKGQEKMRRTYTNLVDE